MAVHPEEYTVDVQTEHLGLNLERIPVASPYAHFANGEGFHVIPEVGAFCWLCIPSDFNLPFVLAYMPPFSLVDDYKANRPDLRPGDQAIMSRDLNAIIIRRGGIVQVMSTPVCQRLYSPIANTIRDICENYELSSAGGTLRWSTRRSTPNEKSESPTTLVLEAREFAQGDPKIILRVGSVETPQGSASSGPRIDTGKKIYLDLEVVGSFRYRINLDGQSLLVQEGRRSIHVKNDEIYFVDGDRELKIMGSESLTVSGSSTRSYDSEDVRVKGTSREKAKRKEIIASEVFLGAVAGAVATILGPKLLTWLKTHTHPLPAAPGVSGVPIQAGTLLGINYLTKNVKVK